MLSDFLIFGLAPLLVFGLLLGAFVRSDDGDWPTTILAALSPILVPLGWIVAVLVLVWVVALLG